MRVFVFVLFALFAAPALAEDYARITDRGTFVGLVQGKSLTAFGVSLGVSPSGTITGRAFGSDVSGTWTWTDGYFCRTLKAGERALPRNCQVVKRKGDRLLFIADKGSGDSANLRIR